MSLFRVLKCQIHRSSAVVQTVINSAIFSRSVGVWKATDLHSHFFGIRALATFSELSHDKEFLNGFEDVSELKSADKNVQQIFSLSNASQKEQRKVVHSELSKKCNNYQERKIAKMTVSIQNLEDHLEKMRNKDKHNKVFLQWLTDQRTKKLKSLKLSNFERYVELVKELGIEPLTSTHSKYAKYKFRRFKIGVEIKEKRSQAIRKMPALRKHSS